MKKGIILANNGENGKACEDFDKAGKLIDKGLLSSQNRGVLAKDLEKQKSRLDPWKNYLGC